MNKYNIHDDSPVRALIPSSPVTNFESAKKRIVFLECLCFQLKTAADLSKLEADRAHKTLSTVESRENQLLNQISSLEDKLIDQNKKLQEIEQKLTEAITQKTNAYASSNAVKQQYVLEKEISSLELQRQKQTITLLTDKFTYIRSRLGYLESAYERLFDKMLQLYDLSQNEETEHFDLAEFIAELRAEILSLEQKISNAEQREFFLKRAYDDSLSELINFKKQHAFRENVRLDEQNNSLCENDYEGNSWQRAVSAHSANAHQSSSTQRSAYTQTDSTEDNKSERLDDVSIELDEQKASFYKSLSNTDRPLVDLFIKDLTEGPESMRPRAATRLIDILGENAASVIVKTATKTETPAIRASLINELSKIPSLPTPSITSIISYFLDDGESIVRCAAIDACIHLAPISQKDQLPLIQKAIKDVSPLVRRKALIFAATSKEIDPGNCCKSLLQDPDSSIRRLAAASFNVTKDPQAIISLFKTVHDAEHNVSIAAATTIEQIFGNALHGLHTLHMRERSAIAEKIVTYISARFNSFFPNGLVLLPEQYSNLFPTEMIISEEERKPSLPTVQKINLQEESTCFHISSNDTLPSLKTIHSFIQSSLLGCSINEMAQEFSLDPTILKLHIDQFIQEDTIIKRGEKLFLP